MKPGRIFVVLVSLALSACGFRPLYGTYGADPGGQRVFSTIYVAPIELERVGYELRNSLIDVLEASADPHNAIYQLNVKLNEKSEGIALNTTGSITRYNYTLKAHYELIDARKGVAITKGDESTLSAYNVVTSPYATLVAKEDAQKRAATDIAERLRLDLGVYFARRARAGR
ncbi:MAG TPA: LPS assembly lipoprotein LptE [Rhizomicrobium sp.]|nr:LPS assembly lipoprotein LptE [Rhizomicrobium sp.]